MGLHIVLYQPEIPANTGNIARTCLGTDTTLHLIHALGVEITDKRLKRAGLDYWHRVKVKEFMGIEELFKSYPEAFFYFVEDYCDEVYSDMDYSMKDWEICVVICLLSEVLV